LQETGSCCSCLCLAFALPLPCLCLAFALPLPFKSPVDRAVTAMPEADKVRRLS
jgi:hypothetical protein